MSSEEDTELRDLVAQTLEVNGCLPKIRAELRASIFLALDEDEELQKNQPMLNKKVKSHLESKEGRTMFCLVREFLQFFDLDFTISVYESESYLGSAYQYEGRSKIIEDLGISQFSDNPTLPLLLQLMQIAQLNSGVPQTKNIDIDLRKLQNEAAKPTENGSNTEQSRTETVEVNEKSVTISEELEKSVVADNSVNGVTNSPKKTKLNETFDLSTPSMVDLKTTDAEMEKPNGPSMDTLLSPRSVDSSQSSTEGKEDTYDGTSSIAEDSIKDKRLSDGDVSVSNSDKSQNALSETEFSPPIVKHSKFEVSFDKLKLSPQKTEKLKTKSSLSSLADLPPLQLNKSRNDTVLLPSLYSKEFKEKNANQNIKEIDKFFDVDSLDNYEEDFMSDSEMNLNKSLEHSKNSIDNLQQSTSTVDSNKSTSGASDKYLDLKSSQKLKLIVTDTNINNNQNFEMNKTENVSSSPKDASGTSDDLNINIDEILNSPTSN